MSGFFSYLSWFQIAPLMVALMSGILALFREVVLIKSPEKAKDGQLFRRCVFITFIVSSVWLWVSEHQQTVELHARLDELATPQLSLSLGQGGPAGVSTQNASGNKMTAFVIITTIKNTGAPSAVLTWKAHYTSRTLDTDVQVGNFTDEPSFQVPGYGDVPVMHKNSIINKASVPIPHNGFITGELALFLPGDRMSEGIEKTTSVTVYITDVTGTQREKTWVSSGKEAPFMQWIPNQP